MSSDQSHSDAEQIRRARRKALLQARVCTPWTLLVHWEANKRPEPSADEWPLRDDYDGSFLFFRALAPAVWLAIVGTCLLIALYVVGYLTADPEQTKGVDPLLKFIEALPEVNLAKVRAGRAFTGVTLAITLALSIACAVWAVAAFRHKDNCYRLVVLAWVAVFFGLSIGVLYWIHAKGFEPYASKLANKLLSWPKLQPMSWGEVGVPELMFGLACFVPVLLAAGACFLLQPLRAVDTDSLAKSQLKVLTGRLNELDQLLYVGALTLVFGTLQLSTSLALPLASMPNPADLKVQADLCKTLPPATPASSPFFSEGPSGSASRPSFFEGFDVEQCRKIPLGFARVEVADDLRQLTRGITLSFGLAFSALLAAIYVPALIGLGLLVDSAQHAADRAGKGDKRTKPHDDKEDKKSSVGDVDPLRRVAAIIATLSPLIAGLLANAFSTG